MVFALPEYERQAALAFREALEALVLAFAPALRAFEVREAETVPTSRVRTPSGGAIEFAPVRNTQTISFEPGAVIDGDLAAVHDAASKTAIRMAEVRLAFMREYLEALTEGMGQVVRVDREMSWEGVMRVIEAAPIGFDDAGAPTFAIWPPAAQTRYDNLGARTPEQEARWQELMSVKREEHRARQRDRRLR